MASTDRVKSVSPNQFMVRAAGGVYFYSSRSPATWPRRRGCSFPNAFAWSSVSDANAKENFRDLADDDVLARIASMPVRQWNYKAQGAAIRHMGPTAQDFHGAFGLGEDPLRISTIDADGVALAGVRALEARTRELRDEHRALKEALAQLRRESRPEGPTLSGSPGRCTQLAAGSHADEVADDKWATRPPSRRVPSYFVLRTSVGILIFHDVEVLDFAGPFEVFSRTRLTPGVDSRRSDDSAPFKVFTVARSPEPVVATGGLRVEPHFAFDTCPPIDVLVVPGGFGTRPLLEDPRVLSWIRATAAVASHTTSVCTGALLLARAGLLRDRRATTHWGALDLLASIDATITVDARPGSSTTGSSLPPESRPGWTWPSTWWTRSVATRWPAKPRATSSTLGAWLPGDSPLTRRSLQIYDGRGRGVARLR